MTSELIGVFCFSDRFALRALIIASDDDGANDGESAAVEQRSHVHRELFERTADWLLATQSDDGAWRIPVRRVFAAAPATFNALEAGWPSAMGQGHALSVLARAFNLTGNRAYARAAASALRPFEKVSARWLQTFILLQNVFVQKK